MSLIKEQFYLAKNSGISIMESNELPDFERQAFMDLLIKSMKEETERMKYNI